MRRFVLALPICLVPVLLFVWSSSSLVRADDEALKQVLQQQQERIRVVEKVKPTVVAIFAKGGKGGGSGVLISKDGYALTNYHVVQPTGALMKCGLADGVLYDAVLVGWDKVGDVALVKLLPKNPGEDFPFAVMGDSDTVREGQWSLAMGNPFLLATDFTPTVTFGMISGVHRYQYPAGTILEYTDCIQIDTSINPGNSGGPLFNMKGELIGINGRGSFDKRSRINSGVGYAISINQIKNFMGHLKAGMDADHATLGALVRTHGEESGLARMEVESILENSDAYRRGLDFGDELVTFDGRVITTVNHFKNVLGVYPRGWRVPLEFRRAGKRKEILVRLMGVQRKVEIEDDKKGKGGKVTPPKTNVPSNAPGAKYYTPKKGFVNYYFNKLERDQVLKGFGKHGDFSKTSPNWTFSGTIRLKQLNNESPLRLDFSEKKNDKGVAEPVVNLRIDAFPWTLNPLDISEDDAEFKQPAGSGGLLAAMYMYQQFLRKGADGMISMDHQGYAPIYVPPTNGKDPESWKTQKVMTEKLVSQFSNFDVNWYFSLDDHKLLAMELYYKKGFEDAEDPCEVYFSDYRVVDGRMLPHTIQVKYANGYYGTITLRNIQIAAAN